MPDIRDGESVQVQGSKGSTYTLRRRGSFYSCSCPAWQHQRVPEHIRTCKHLKAYLGEEHENNRCGADTATGARGSAGVSNREDDKGVGNRIAGERSASFRNSSMQNKSDSDQVEVNPRRRGAFRGELLDKLEKLIDGARYDDAEQLCSSLWQQMSRAEFFQQDNERFHKDFNRLSWLRTRLFREQSAAHRRRLEATRADTTALSDDVSAADLDDVGEDIDDSALVQILGSQSVERTGRSGSQEVSEIARRDGTKNGVGSATPSIVIWSPRERYSMFYLLFERFPMMVAWCLATIISDVQNLQKVPSGEEQNRWLNFIGGLPRFLNPDVVYDALYMDDAFRDYRVWEMLNNQHALQVVTDALPSMRSNLKVAIAMLSKNRILDRTRLLDTCVHNAFSWTDRTHVTWMITLYDELKPDQAERKRYLEQYLNGLDAKDSICVGWSLEQVTLAYSDKLIDASRLCARIPALIGRRSTPINDHCIKLLKLMAKREKNLPGVFVNSALPLLDVAEDATQSKFAIDLIETYGDPSDMIFAKALHKRLEKLEGPQQHKLRLWLDASAYGDHMRAANAAAHKSDQSEVQDMLGQIDGCDSDLIDLADIDLAAAFARCQSHSAPALDLGHDNMPRLCAEHAIEPITNINDLIYAFIRVLDRKTTGDEIERVLDGMSRLCDDRPFDFKTRVGRLKDRAVQRLQPEQFQDATELVPTQPFGGVSHQEDLAGLALVWTDGNNLAAYKKLCPRLEMLLFRNTSLSRHVMNGLSLHSFFSARVLPIALRVLQKTATPLLAAPTHKNGWIDPRVISERLIRFEQLQMEPSQFDVAQALLRLAPEFKKEAMQALLDLKGEIAAAFRYALGGELAEETTKSWLWATAARARSPQTDDPKLCARFSKMQADTLNAAVYDMGYCKPQTLAGQTVVVTGSYLSPKDYLIPRDESITTPTALFHCKPYTMFQLQFMNKRVWEPLVWPQFRESYFAGEARQVLMHIDSQGRYWLDAWEPAFDPDTYMKGMARFLILFGLAAKREECFKQAVEVLNLAIEDGRLDGESFGDAVATTIFTKQIVVARWMAAVDEVASVSPLHKLAMKRMLEHAIVGVSKLGSPPPRLLPRLYELATTCGEGIIFEEARTRLGSISVSKGASRQTAAALLELKSIDSNPIRREAGLQLLQRRIDRVLRWQAYRDSMREKASAST